MRDAGTPMESRLENAVRALAASLRQRFTPPEFIPGCQVKSIAAINEYATGNGWIEAICGQHNQQRVRYTGFPAGVAVDDLVDVIHLPDLRIFKVFGAGGTTATGLNQVQVSELWESDGGAVAVWSDASGNLGVGVSSPQGRLHLFDGTGGKILWSATGIDATAVTIIPDGPGDVTTICRFKVIVVREVAGNPTNTLDGEVANGSNIDIFNNAGDVLNLRVNTDGSMDVRQTGGTSSYTVVLDAIWT